MTRLRALLLRPELRAVLGQAQPRFDLGDVFTQRRCLLVRLPKGTLGAEGTRLLGSLLVGHLWRLAQGRAAIPAERRHPVTLVLDEFQEFLRLPLDLGDALVQARGLGVGLTLAHQHLLQLDPAIRAAVLANAGSRVAFRLDFDDAGIIAKRSAGRLDAEDLMGLEPFEAYASLMAGAAASPYGSLVTRPLDPPIHDVDEVLAANRDGWGIRGADTEARLIQLTLGDRPPPSSGVSRGELGRRRPPGDQS